MAKSKSPAVVNNNNDEINVINYITDQENGAKLIFVYRDRGWVEHVKNTTKIYASLNIPEDLYNSLYSSWLSQLNLENEKGLGFVRHMVDTLENRFIFPAFAIADKDEIKLTCGSTRFMAMMCKAADLDAMGLVIFSQIELDRPDFVEITSTQQFIDFFDLKDYDHKIKMSEADNKIAVTGSYLQYTFYATTNPLEHGSIVRISKDIDAFWKPMLNDDSKIKIKIHCDPKLQEFVKPSKYFDVTFIDETDKNWGFSFGRLLGAFKPDKDGVQIYRDSMVMWLFWATEKFDLDLWFPLLDVNHTFAYTKNQSAVMFSPNHYTDFKIVGNIVK